MSVSAEHLDTETSVLSAEMHWPKGASYPVRKPALKLDASPRYWADNNALLTWHMNVLSSAFPDGERFFVDSVRAFRDQISDPRLRREVAAFIGQEARHAEQHERLNGIVGARAKRLERRVAKLAGNLRKIFPKRWQLGATACCEHFTATWAATLLRNRDLLDSMQDAQMRKLWAWHAIEETEHKATAFDVYRQTGGSEALRIGLMPLTTVVLMGYIILLPLVIEMARDGQLANPREVMRGLKKLVGPKGFYPATVREYLDWYRPGFHPDDHDTRALLDEWRERLGLAEAMMEEVKH